MKKMIKSNIFFSNLGKHTSIKKGRHRKFNEEYEKGISKLLDKMFLKGKFIRSNIALRDP